MTISPERLRELKKHHKERALHFEGASDGMRLMETFKESAPHWELVDIIGELEQARTRIAELETRLELAERAKQELRQGHQRLLTTLEGVAKGTHVIESIEQIQKFAQHRPGCCYRKAGITLGDQPCDCGYCGFINFLGGVHWTNRAMLAPEKEPAQEKQT